MSRAQKVGSEPVTRVSLFLNEYDRKFLGSIGVYWREEFLSFNNRIEWARYRTLRTCLIMSSVWSKFSYDERLEALRFACACGIRIR